MAADVVSPIGSMPMVTTKRLEGTLVAPIAHLPVPNYLTDTRVHCSSGGVLEPLQTPPDLVLESKIYSKAKKDGCIQTNPSVVHFEGYQVGQTHRKVLRVVNTSRENQQMHIIPPSTSFFSIKYTKEQRSLVPGLSLDITIHFRPTAWQYYYDCIRIHCKGEDNILVPIHAYPVMDVSKFPRMVTFPLTPVGESHTKSFALECSVPTDFEFQLSCLQSHPAFTVAPMQGVVPGNGRVEIAVTFVPTEFNTAIMKLQLEVSQFNSSPVVCTFTGSSSPGLAVEKLKRRPTQQKLAAPRAVTKTHRLPPLERAGRGKEGEKKRRKVHSVVTLPSRTNAEEVTEYRGLLFPANIDSPHAVGKMLTQQPSRVRASRLREGGESACGTRGPGSRHAKEKAFLQKVRQAADEERANQLRWATRLGDLAMTSEERQAVLQAREEAHTAYQRYSHMVVPEEEFARCSTEGAYRRTRRKAGEYPDHTPHFDPYSNDVWSRRYRALRRFVQAARKVVVRVRCEQRLARLGQLRRSLQAGMSEAHALAEMSGKRTPPLDIVSRLPSPSDCIVPFSFPRCRPEAESFAGVAVERELKPTVISVERTVPYLDLRVPQQYKLLGYSPVATPTPGSYVSPQPPVSYRTGALEELEDLAAIPGVDPAFLAPAGLFGAPDGGSQSGTTDQDREGRTEEEEGGRYLPLVPPSELFEPPQRHPMHIFDPCQGTVAYFPMLPHSEVSLDHALLPLPPYPSAQHPQVRLDPKDVIPGVMRWKQQCSHYLVATEGDKKLSQAWRPTWSDPFSKELLPDLPEPELLTGPQPGDIYDENSTELLAVPTLEMVRAKFYIPSKEEGEGQDERLAVQARLAEENRQCFNELGGHVLQRLERMLEHGQVPQTKNVVPTPTLPAPKLRVMVEDATSHSSRGQSSQTDNMTTTVDSD